MPNNFENPCICPITQEPFINPVIDPCGHSFEKSAIYEWIDTRDGEAPCPLNNNRILLEQDLKPNVALKNLLICAKTLSSDNTLLKEKIENTAKINEVLNEKLKVVNLIDEGSPSSTATATLNNPAEDLDLDKTSREFIKSYQDTTRIIANCKQNTLKLKVSKAILANSILKNIHELTYHYQQQTKLKNDTLYSYVNKQSALKTELFDIINVCQPGHADIKPVDSGRLTEISNNLNALVFGQKQAANELQRVYQSIIEPRITRLQKKLFVWHDLQSNHRDANAIISLMKKNQLNAIQQAAIDYSPNSANTMKCFGKDEDPNSLVDTTADSRNTQDFINQKLATAVGNKDVVEAKYWLDKKADVNVKANPFNYLISEMNTLSNPLITIACTNCDLHMVRLLRSYQVNVNNRSGGLYATNQTAIFRLVGLSSTPHSLLIFSELMSAGAEINIADNNGDTPLHWAAHRGKYWLTSLLLASGADPFLLNNEGKTPREELIESISIGSRSIKTYVNNLIELEMQRRRPTRTNSPESDYNELSESPMDRFSHFAGFTLQSLSTESDRHDRRESNLSFSP